MDPEGKTKLYGSGAIEVRNVPLGNLELSRDKLISMSVVLHNLDGPTTLLLPHCVISHVEMPILANGNLTLFDGGFSPSYLVEWNFLDIGHVEQCRSKDRKPEPRNTLIQLVRLFPRCGYRCKLR